ncbi:MAG: hypothetical protein ABI488_23570 [Polyangiaceae bacterium]
MRAKLTELQVDVASPLGKHALSGGRLFTVAGDCYRVTALAEPKPPSGLDARRRAWVAAGERHEALVSAAADAWCGPATEAPAASNEAEAQRAAMRRRGIRFAVAPAASITTPSGVVLASGTATSVADWHGGARPAWALLADAVRDGRVLEA